MTRRNALARWIHAALLCWAPHVLAQHATAPVAPEQPQPLEAIVVTGTHIRAVDVETEHPVTVLTRDELLRTGLTGIAEILQSQLVASGETLNRNVNNGGTGELTVDLRGLGANRTLVLLNGQRWVSAIDGAVDLTAIPLALVERIEVLKDGASAIYGSDAIAGVVNIITRRNFEGAELGAHVAANSHGDGLGRAADFTWGGGFGGWNVAGGVEWSREDAILARSRPISAVPVYGVPLQVSGSSGTPYGYYEPADLPYFPDGWVRIPGTSGRSPGDYRVFEPALDANYNYARYNYLQTPQERRAVFAQARFDATPDLSFAMDALFNQRRSAQQLAPPTLGFSDYLFEGAQQFGVAADNVYNPFGMVVDTVRLRIADLADRRFEQTVDTQRLHAGVDGVFTLAGRELHWGVDANHIRASLREATAPYADNERLALAVGPSFLDSGGVARCGAPDAVIAGCVPLDVFGPPDAVTPAMLEYIAVSETNRKRDQTRGFTTHVTGPFADLPAGAAQFAAGVGRRWESGYDHPDPLVVSGRENGNGRTLGATRGAYTVDEAYVEVDLPLLAGRPAARELGVTLASRYSGYSLFGSTTNSKIGLRWKPVADLLVRSAWGQGFRAPSLLEAFGGQAIATTIGGLVDPCAAAGHYLPDAVTAARCRAQGVPDAVGPTEIATITTGGSADLRPETSRTLTAGFVFSPARLPGVSVSVDWYRITLRDAMAYTSAQALVDSCYFGGSASACTRVTRRPSGEIANVLALQHNLPGGLEVEGWDFALHWRRATRAGDFALRWDNAYVDYWGELGKPRRGATLADGSLAEGNVAGTSNWQYGTVWRWRSVLSVTWRRAAWSASLAIRHFSPIGEDCGLIVYYAEVVGDPALRGLCSAPDHTLDGYADPRNRVPSVTYFDFALGWNAPWRGQFMAGTRNAFDRNPPVSRSAINSFFSEYDVPGRYWWAGYRQPF